MTDQALRLVLDSALVDEGTKLRLLNDLLDRDLTEEEAEEIFKLYNIGMLADAEKADWARAVKEMKRMGFTETR